MMNRLNKMFKKKKPERKAEGDRASGNASVIILYRSIIE